MSIRIRVVPECMKTRLILILAALSIFLLPEQSLAAKQFQVDTGGTLTTNLVAYYQLDDLTEYYVGGGTLDLTNNNSVAFNAGKVSNAADMGTSTTAKYLSVANNLGIDGGNISISGWMRVDANPPNGTSDGYMLSNSNTSDVSYMIAYRNIGGTLNLAFNRRRNAVQDNWINYATTLTLGTWYMVTLTYDGTNLRGYLNGSLVAGPTAKSGSGSDAWPDESGVGRSYNLGSKAGDGQYAEGLVDETGFWNRALSGTEISDLYNGGSGQTMIDGLSLSNLQQYESDATTIAEGSKIIQSTSTIVFGATLLSPGTSTLQLQVEVKSASTSFTNIANVTSSFVSPNSSTTATVMNFVPGNYHWQARILENGTNNTSTWKSYGTSATSFIVDPAESAYFDGDDAWRWPAT